MFWRLRHWAKKPHTRQSLRDTHWLRVSVTELFTHWEWDWVSLWVWVTTQNESQLIIKLILVFKLFHMSVTHTKYHIMYSPLANDKSILLWIFTPRLPPEYIFLKKYTLLDCKHAVFRKHVRKFVYVWLDGREHVIAKVVFELLVWIRKMYEKLIK